MSRLSWVSRVPEVKGAVVGDLAGAVLDAIDDADSETTAAISGFASSTIQEVGESLGLGLLERFTISGKGFASVVTVMGDAVVTAHVDPSKPLSAAEKRIDAALRG